MCLFVSLHNHAYLLCPLNALCMCFKLSIAITNKFHIVESWCIRLRFMITFVQPERCVVCIIIDTTTNNRIYYYAGVTESKPLELLTDPEPPEPPNEPKGLKHGETFAYIVTCRLPMRTKNQVRWYHVYSRRDLRLHFFYVEIVADVLCPCLGSPCIFLI